MTESDHTRRPPADGFGFGDDSGGRHAADDAYPTSPGRITVTLSPSGGAAPAAGPMPPPGSVVSISTPHPWPAVESHPSDTTPVTCPECGTVSTIDSTQRDASDFCPSCDFPLFWAPGAMPARELAAAGDGALRRLPGTVGRAALASLTCPVCAEPNSPMALICVRCGSSLIPAAPPPPPPPAPVIAPLPPLVEEPRKINWWLIISLTVLAVVIITLAILYGLDVIF